MQTLMGDIKPPLNQEQKPENWGQAQGVVLTAQSSILLRLLTCFSLPFPPFHSPRGRLNPKESFELRFLGSVPLPACPHPLEQSGCSPVCPPCPCAPLGLCSPLTPHPSHLGFSLCPFPALGFSIFWFLVFATLSRTTPIFLRSFP